MSIARNSLANVIGAITPLAVTLITVPIYIRLIGEERYGVLAIIWVILAYFMFFDIGLGKATAQRISKLGKDENNESNKILWTSIMLTLVLGITGGFVLWCFADFILSRFVSMNISNREEALGAIQWLIIVLPVLVINSALGGALQARERFIEINAIGILCNVTNQIAPLLMALTGYINLEHLVPVSFIGNCIMCILYFKKCTKYVPLKIKPEFDTYQMKSLLHYGSGATLISILGPLLVTFDRILIGVFIGAKSVTFYAVPFSLISRILIISGSLSNALFPRLAAYSAIESEALSIRSTKSLVSIISPIIIIGVACIHPFLAVWISNDFANKAAGIGEILFLGVWINCLATSHFARLQATGKLKIIIIIYLFEIPVYFLMVWAGLQVFGLTGVAAAWSLRVLIDTIIMLNVSNVLKKTLSDNILSILLFALTAAIFFITKYIYSWAWAGFILLFLISIKLGWKQYVEIFHSIFIRNPAPA